MKGWNRRKIKPIKSQKEFDKIMQKVVKTTCEVTGCSPEEATKRFYRQKNSKVCQKLLEGKHPNDKEFQFIIELYMSTPSYSPIMLKGIVLEPGNTNIT